MLRGIWVPTRFTFGFTGGSSPAWSKAPATKKSFCRCQLLLDAFCTFENVQIIDYVTCHRYCAASKSAIIKCGLDFVQPSRSLKVTPFAPNKSGVNALLTQVSGRPTRKSNQSVLDLTDHIKDILDGLDLLHQAAKLMRSGEICPAVTRT